MTFIKNTRREFIKGITATSVMSATSIPVIAGSLARPGTESPDSGVSPGMKPDAGSSRPVLYDGPASPLFNVIGFEGNASFASFPVTVSERMVEAAAKAPVGQGTAWGIPFQIPEHPVVVKERSFSMQIDPVQAKYLVFLHTTDFIDLVDEHGDYIEPFKGTGQLGEELADYIFEYADGSEERTGISGRVQIGMCQQHWGENSIQAVAHHKPRPLRAHHEQITGAWGGSQTRVSAADRGDWINWLWAWENPYPAKQITGIRFEPRNKTAIVIAAITSGQVSTNPLKWERRQRAIFSIPGEGTLDPKLDGNGLLSQVQLDLGQVISALPRAHYDHDNWETSYNNQVPGLSYDEVIIEYTAHPEAKFHLADGRTITVSDVKNPADDQPISALPPALQHVKIRVYEKGSRKPVPVKLHVHGGSGEYLAPVDRHRIPNNAWFEDYSVDFIHAGRHICTYIPGETNIKLPQGKVYIEVSKGFEIRPLRKVVTITGDTETIEIEIDRLLSWREKGWVSADTHVHFLSPNTALLEGSAEGVNIINLLASQWGELFTNIGDFDGKTTLGSREAGGDGEYLVRVGTENRQHVLGHISLLGYEGDLITPLTTGGPDESALGDPVETLLTEWASRCKKQDGIVVLPHFPNPRLENAAAIVSGNVDGVEMTSWGNLYSGIDPYSLADWYRYLNCGYFVAAVGGTDKMSAGTAVGTVRTYAKIRDDQEFSYDEWKQAVRKGHTFVSYGPLMEFTVDGQPMGSRMDLSSNGGTVDISWQVASVTVPITRVELIMNGEVKESQEVPPDGGSGNWNRKVDKSSWFALLVRGHYPDKPEIITAHSSPVMIHVDGSGMMAAADALTILEQIEGSMAYLDTIGTRADENTYKRLRLMLASAHRSLHNRMHQLGQFHRHSPLTDHPEHKT